MFFRLRKLYGENVVSLFYFALLFFFVSCDVRDKFGLKV